MSDYNWLAQLKVGDEVVVEGLISGDGIRLVEAVSNVSITVCGIAFARSPEPLRVGRTLVYSLSEVTPEKRARIDHAVACRKLRGIEWELLPLSTLRELLSIVRRQDNGGTDK